MRVVLRFFAFLLLAALLVGVPVAVFKIVGVPLPGADELRDAWQRRQIGGDLVVRIGAAVFAVLWLWFAATAVAELWHVVAWRVGGSSARLAPVPAGPSGVIRQLVRFIVVSSVTATATFGSFVPLARASISPPVVTPAAATTVRSTTAAVHTVTAPMHLAVGRETPFSLAAMLGRADLRDTIIELNLGRVGPDGMEWQGGVFPAGMEVALPVEQVVDTPLGPAHEVVGGDSYWEIADDHLGISLGRDATNREVLEYTESLMTANHELLGHRDPAMIVPGELVIFTSVGATSAADTPVVTDIPIVASAPAAVETPVVEVVRPEPSRPDVIIYLPAIVEAQAAVVSDAVEPSVADSFSPTIVKSPSESGGVVPYAAGLGAALMVSAGAVGAIESRRRRQLRSATIGTRLLVPSAVQVRTEVLLRSLNSQERFARLDLALRSAAPSLAAQSASVLAAVMYDSGDVRLFLRGSATPASPVWKIDVHANTWRLPASVSLAALAEHARLSAQPCPAMVHVGGVAEGGELFVDLEAVGSFLVQSPCAAAVLRSIAASLAVSPFIEAARIFTVGLGDVSLGSQNSESVDSLDAALDAASMSLGSTSQLTRAGSTFGLRVAGVGGEAWEPSVVVALVDEGIDPLDGVLRAVAAGGRGLAVVVGTEESSTDCGAPLEPDAGWALRFISGQHVLEPLGFVVHPVGVSEADVACLADLIDSSELTTIDLEVADVPHLVFDTAPPASVEFAAPEWSLMVRVLGPIHAAT